MSFGIVEVITLLLSLAGFGIGTNPKAETPDQALEYAMPDADLVVHVDVAALIPDNYKALTKLVDQPAIKASPELSQMVRQVVGEIEGARGMAKTSTGIDLTTDISDVDAFVKLHDRNEPDLVLVGHGKFTVANIEKIANAAHQSIQRTAGGAYVEMDGKAALGITKSNALVAGTTALVKARLADSWKAPARAKDSILAYASEVVAQKPVYAMVAALSSEARAMAMSKHGPENFGTDLLKRHKVAAFSVYNNGIGWTWVDSKPDGAAQIATISEGLVELFRAGQIAPRGFAKIVLAGLESYRGVDKHIDEVLREKDNVMKIVTSFTGDGTFKAQIDHVKAANRVNVRLTGKTVSEVVPFAFAMPVMGALVFARAGGGRKQEEMAAPAVVPAKPQPKPATPPKPAKPVGTGLTH